MTDLDAADDLSSDIAAALDKATADPVVDAGEAPASGVQPEASPPATDGERARDASGRFAPKTEDAKSVVEEKKPAATPDVAATAQPQAAQTKPTAPSVAPPEHWKGDGKINWAKVHPAVQQAIVEDHARLTTTQGELNQLKSAIGEQRAQVLAATYGSVGQGIQNLLSVSDMATKNPTGFVLWFAQQRGIDLTQLVGQGGGQGTQPTNQPHPLEQEVIQLRNQVQGMVQQQTQGTQTQLQSEIDAFAKDPARPYFNDVRQDMSRLIQSGQAKDLNDAYDQAVWARQDIRASLLDAERRKVIDANAAKVAQASRAAGSITGSPSGAHIATNDELEMDLETTIRRNVDRALAS